MSLFEGELFFMCAVNWFHFGQQELYEIHCPFCGKWVCDTNMKMGIIIQPCRECGKKIVILNWGDGPFVFKDRRKKARLKVRVNPS